MVYCRNAATLRNLALSKFLEVRGRVSDVKFKPIQDTMDTVMKRSVSLGLGIDTRQAKITSEEMENVLWERGLLGYCYPQLLLNTMI